MYSFPTKSLLVLRQFVAMLLVLGVVPAAGAGQVGLWRLDAPQISASDRTSQSLLGSAIDLPKKDPFTCSLRLSLAEQSLLADAADGRLDEHSLFSAALISEQIPAAEMPLYEEQFRVIVEEVKREASSADVAGRLQAIHRVLHRRWLKQYDAGASQLSAVFRDGRYNCVSGTILLLAISENLGFATCPASGETIEAIELPGHVRVLVNCNGRKGEIEVTCPDWAHAVRWDETASVEPEEASPAASRRVSSLGLLAMLYFNRGVDAIHDQQYAIAVEANRTALLFDADNRLARGNLLAAVNNWALALASTGRAAEASFLISAGQRYEPAHQPFAHNAAYLRQLIRSDR